LSVFTPPEGCTLEWEPAIVAAEYFSLKDYFKFTLDSCDVDYVDYDIYFNYEDKFDEVKSYFLFKYPSIDDQPEI